MKTGIQGTPDMIKPNIHELSRLTGLQLNNIGEIISAAQTICDKGTGIVLVSMGAKGILLVSEKEQHLAVPPQVKVGNTIGAGDSAIGGFVYGQVSGKTLQEALIYGVAAGTATTLRPGPALCTKEDFQDLVPQVKLHSGDEITKYLK